MDIDTRTALLIVNSGLAFGTAGYVGWYHAKEKNRDERIEGISDRLHHFEGQLISRAEHEQFARTVADTVTRMESFAKETFRRMESEMTRIQITFTDNLKTTVESLRHEFGRSRE